MCTFFLFSRLKTAYEMRISDWSSDVCSSDLLDGTAETGRTVNRFAYQTKPHAQIFTTDNNGRFSFDTGPFSHELLAGVDYSNYFERTFTASGMGTPIDIYNPVSSGVSVLPYTLLPEQRNTQLGLYVQDQIRYADRIRSEEHTSELQSLMRTSYAVFCLKK